METCPTSPRLPGCWSRRGPSGLWLPPSQVVRVLEVLALYQPFLIHPILLCLCPRHSHGPGAAAGRCQEEVVLMGVFRAAHGALCLREPLGGPCV